MNKNLKVCTLLYECFEGNYFFSTDVMPFNPVYQRIHLNYFQDVGMPADFVNKLQRMFQDIKVSEDLNHEFKDTSRNNNEGIGGICINLIYYVKPL